MITEVIKERKSSDSYAEQAVKRWFKGATDRKDRKLQQKKYGLKLVSVLHHFFCLFSVDVLVMVCQVFYYFCTFKYTLNIPNTWHDT